MTIEKILLTLNYYSITNWNHFYKKKNFLGSKLLVTLKPAHSLLFFVIRKNYFLLLWLVAVAIVGKVRLKMLFRCLSSTKSKRTSAFKISRAIFIGSRATVSQFRFISTTRHVYGPHGDCFFGRTRNEYHETRKKWQQRHCEDVGNITFQAGGDSGSFSVRRQVVEM